MSIKAQSVSDLVGSIKKSLETSFMGVTVTGEISNLSHSSAGHWYFTLSDNSSSISIALFKMDAYRNPFIKQTKNGDQVVISGPISVYQKKGTFQLLAKKILPAGVGNLALEFEKLKKKLTIEGLFDLSIKREIPRFPDRIGVITALSGAALQDFLNVLKRRSFWGEVIVIPAIVQGDNSARSLRDALSKALQIELLDCIIFTRGGGAIEDLWSFNNEDLVRDIFDCPIPVVSAVGHQVDYTLCDFVADKRVETPTAAAQMLSEPHMALSQKLEFIGHKLKSLLYIKHSEIDKKLKRLSPLNVIHIIKEDLHRKKDQLSRLELSSRKYELIQFYEKEQYLDDLLVRMNGAVDKKQQGLSVRMSLLEGKLSGLDPSKVLSRGFTMIHDGEKNIITNLEKFNKIKAQTPLNIHFYDGQGVVEKK